MKNRQELEEIVRRVHPHAAESIDETLGLLENEETDREGAYQMILEAIVYDILNTPRT